MVYIEKYFHQLSEDLNSIEDDIAQPLSEALHAGLVSEQAKLQAMEQALTGGLQGKSPLHALRAKLRWARARATSEHDPANRRRLEDTVSSIQAQISHEVGTDKVIKGKKH